MQLGKSTILDVNVALYQEYSHRAKTLLGYLKTNHGFQISMSDPTTMETLPELIKETKSSLLVMNLETFDRLEQDMIDRHKATSQKEGTSKKEKTEQEKEPTINLIQNLKNQVSIRVLITKIEDSTSLTRVINAGADYGTGEFLGQQQPTITDSANVQTFQLN